MMTPIPAGQPAGWRLSVAQLRRLERRLAQPGERLSRRLALAEARLRLEPALAWLVPPSFDCLTLALPPRSGPPTAAPRRRQRPATTAGPPPWPGAATPAAGGLAGQALTPAAAPASGDRPSPSASPTPRESGPVFRLWPPGAPPAARQRGQTLAGVAGAPAAGGPAGQALAPATAEPTLRQLLAEEQQWRPAVGVAAAGRSAATVPAAEADQTPTTPNHLPPSATGWPVQGGLVVAEGDERAALAAAPAWAGLGRPALEGPDEAVIGPAAGQPAGLDRLAALVDRVLAEPARPSLAGQPAAAVVIGEIGDHGSLAPAAPAEAEGGQAGLAALDVVTLVTRALIEQARRHGVDLA